MIEWEWSEWVKAQSEGVFIIIIITRESRWEGVGGFAFIFRVRILGMKFNGMLIAWHNKG